MFLVLTLVAGVWGAGVYNTQGVLDKVNGLRARHGSVAVAYDDKLNAVSQGWADTLAGKDVFEHSPNSYGENIAMAWGASDLNGVVLDSIDRWYAEVDKYDWSKPVYSGETGHFTQLVWNATRRIGLGVGVTASQKVYVVMNYDPAGNFGGQFEKNVGQLVVPVAMPVATPVPVATPARFAPPWFSQVPVPPVSIVNGGAMLKVGLSLAVAGVVMVMLV